MFENIMRFFKKFNKGNENVATNSKDAAKERLHLVLMQDRANVSADFLELMKQEIIDVIKKYIDVDESAIDVRLTNKENSDGTNGAPALYANIPILNIKNEARKVEVKDEEKKEQEDKKQEDKEVSKKEESTKKSVKQEKNEKIETKEEKKKESSEVSDSEKKAKEDKKDKEKANSVKEESNTKKKITKEEVKSEK